MTIAQIEFVKTMIRLRKLPAEVYPSLAGLERNQLEVVRPIARGEK